MHQFNDYINLRQNLESRQSDTSIWPSFTDIMTVVLMIFMLTMVAVIIKNSDLYNQLLKSKAKEQQAMKSLHDIKSEQENLQTIIVDLEEKLRSKEMEIILINDEMDLVRSSLEAKVALISMLEDSTFRLTSKVASLENSTRSMQQDLAQQIAEFNRRFAALADSLNRSKQIILVLNSEKKDLALSLAKQRNTYSKLEKKYNKLIRAARSPVGKKVATVHYSRVNGKYRILFKGIGATKYEPVTREQMHQRLSALKNQWQKKLYVKVIIPNKSGLSYNEAWSFTRKILSLYDYYDQP